MLAQITTILILVVAMVYIVYMFLAYSNGKNKMLALSPWWCLYMTNYEKEGRENCKKGRVLLVLLIVLNIVLFLVKNPSGFITPPSQSNDSQNAQIKEHKSE